MKIFCPFYENVTALIDGKINKGEGSSNDLYPPKTTTELNKASKEYIEIDFCNLFATLYYFTDKVASYCMRYISVQLYHFSCH